MGMTYKQALEEFRKGFDKETWKRHKKRKAILKSFARLNASGAVLCTKEEVEENNSVFVKSYRFIGLSHINSNAEVFRNLRMLNELLVPILAKQIGLEGATYLYKQEKGAVNYDGILDVLKPVKMPNALVSKNFLKENEELFDRDFYHHDCRSGYSLKCFLDDLKYMVKREHLTVDMEEIKSSFFKMMILDLLTLQLDRHEGNLPLILNKTDNSVRFGFIFDNEFSFNVKSFKDYDLEKDEYRLLNNGGKFDVEKVIDSYDKRILKLGDYMWTVSPTCHKNYHSCLKGIAMQAKLSSKARKILAEVIKNLDVEGAFESLKEMGVEFNPAYKDFTKQIVNYGKNCFIREINKGTIEKKSSSSEKTKND